MSCVLCNKTCYCVLLCIYYGSGPYTVIYYMYKCRCMLAIIKRSIKNTTPAMMLSATTVYNSACSIKFI
jgi:hypothetical protein